MCSSGKIKENSSKSETLLLFSVFFSVVVFNAHIPFVDLLWHDDQTWIYRAATDSIYQDWRAKTAFLVPLKDYFYSFSLFYLGVPFARIIYVCILALSSVLFYIIYNKIFGIRKSVSFASAVVPNILPSLIGIPIGLNNTYAVWSLIPTLSCLILLRYAIFAEKVKFVFLSLLSLLLFVAGLNFSSAGIFLIPNVLLFCLFFVRANKYYLSVCLGFFVSFGAWQVYKQAHLGSKAPVAFEKAVFVKRLHRFFEVCTPLPKTFPYVEIVVPSLMLVGVLVLLFFHRRFVEKPDHFKNVNNLYYGVLVALWPALWVVSNIAVYLTVSPDFRIDTYSYVANFGVSLLMLTGTLFVAGAILYPFTFFLKHKPVYWVLAVLLICFTGGYRYVKTSHAYTKYEKDIHLLRSNLGQYSFPPNSQIVTLGGFSAFNQGLTVSNSGIFIWIFNREDLRGMIGKDQFPADLFSKFSWSKRMRGIDPDKPLFVFAKDKKAGLERVKLLLSTTSSKLASGPRIMWRLYDVSSPGGEVVEMASGSGLKSYYDYLKDGMPVEFVNESIAFSPSKGIAYDIIDQDSAKEFLEGSNLIQNEVQFEDVVTLGGVKCREIDPKKQAINLVFRVDKNPKYRIGFSLNGKRKYLPIYDLAMAGDYVKISVSTPKSKNAKLEFFKANRWPHPPIKIKDNSNENNGFLSVDLEACSL
ncbi:MAG: hypothetical protein C0617_08035 [Desulfuromonas sp.]|uniref:hypothetical protein n=1 Tax=Desulfuromonas sp. TaxID=892 RepID=UPI000CC94BB1|nr:hypothetical protein [Desulfuromonas sp.]PLX84425.1 MAG: hypothetical protein C0617_08035 [Desulfuromonas sp.]